VNLMLAVLFVCVGLGLLAPRFGRRENFVVVGIAIAMSVLYLFQGMRFI
jgi:hypothetical protein